MMMRLIIFTIFFFLASSSINAASLGNSLKNDEGKITFDLDLAKKTYAYRLQTPDGTVKHEKGYFEADPSTGEENLVAEGGYGYTGDDGKQYIVSYKADKNGYRPYVSFGSRFGGYGGGAAAAAGAATPSGKGIDPALLCSLAGSGC